MRNFLIGLALGGIGGFGLSFVNAAGSAAWHALAGAVSVRWSRYRAERGAEREASHRASNEAAARNELAAERQDIEQERVGVQFRKRYTANDSGTILTVIGLAPSEWRTDVVLEEAAPPGRIPTEFDSTLTTVQMKWSTLVTPHSVQRHATARLMMKSFDDSDGWVEFERIPTESG